MMLSQIEQRETTDTIRLLSDEKRLQIAETELERARVLLKIKELEVKARMQPQTVINNPKITNINAKKIVVNYLGLGNENLAPLTSELLAQSSQNFREAFTSTIIQQLYFNPNYPENFILKPPKQSISGTLPFFDGKSWIETPIEKIAPCIISSASNATEKKFRELKDNRELDDPYERFCKFNTHYIDSTRGLSKLVDIFTKNLQYLHIPIGQEKWI